MSDSLRQVCAEISISNFGLDTSTVECLDHSVTKLDGRKTIPIHKGTLHPDTSMVLNILVPGIGEPQCVRSTAVLVIDDLGMAICTTPPVSAIMPFSNW